MSTGPANQQEIRTVPQILAAVAAVVIVIAAVAGLFVVGWRAKSGLVLRPIIAFSKRYMNPRQMRTAGTPGAYAAIIRHRGRTSGNAYETPVGVVTDGDAYLIALPYGTRAQWLRNVLAAGSAELVHEGSTVRVDHPELVPMASVAEHFTSSDQGMFKALKVDQALRLQAAA
jgi:deazaflavin-dependent oxidoreductase (nitroreductase family)